jgi:hypothetical protein
MAESRQRTCAGLLTPRRKAFAHRHPARGKSEFPIMSGRLSKLLVSSIYGEIQNQKPALSDSARD